MTLTQSDRAARRVAVIGALLLVALGVTVMGGWLGGSVRVIQLHPSLAPMQLNTALGFLLCGLGLLAAARGRPVPARALGAVVVLFGALTLLEYLFDLDLGIDHLALSRDVTVATTQPGRMGPNTALGFLLIGGAVVAGAARRHPLLVAVLSTLSLSLGAAALFGYATGVESAYGWRELTRMAAHTAAGLIVGGAAGFAHARSAATSPWRWTPLPVAIGSLTLTIALWQALAAHETRLLGHRVEEETAALAGEITTLVEPRLRTLERMADRWETVGRPGRDSWERDARAYVADQPGLLALAWVDDAQVARWVVPAHAQPGAATVVDTQGAMARSVLQAARDDDRASISVPATLEHGGPGFLIGLPLRRGGVFDGVLLAAVDFDRLIGPLSEHRLARGYAVRLRHGTDLLHSRPRGGSSEHGPWTEQTIEVRGIPWRVGVRPLRPGLSPMPTMTLLLLLALSATLTLAVHLSGRARAGAAALERVNLQLAEHARTREEVQRALEGHRASLEQAVAERTADLARTNRALDAEVAERLEAQQRLAFAIEAARIGTWSWDTRSDVMRWDTHMHAIFGTDPATFAPAYESFRACIHPDDAQAVDFAMTQSLARDAEFHVEHRILRGSPRVELRHVEARGRAIRDDAGKPWRMAGVCIDVTGRREVEQTLRELNEELERRVAARTADLERANRDLESFSYSVSHDLRAPLRHAKGFADMLVRHYDGALDDRGKRYLETISGSVARMNLMIDALLEFSRTGRAELRRRPVSLAKVVAEARAGLASHAPGRDIAWKVADDLPEVDADPTLLGMVIENLLSNAVKFTAKRERPTIEIGWRPGDEGEVAVHVRDDGAGFDSRYADKLFSVFQRLHHREDFAGTGIGLANVRRIVERHGGRVWAEGEPGRGATFFFTLPLPPTPPPGAP